MSEPRRYALRRLNPFLGVTQVVDSANGRALSVDGVNWEIQLITSQPPGWGVLNRGRGENVFFRFGVWSRADGLARFPPARNVDPNAAEKSAAALLAEIAEAIPALPFSLIDTLECWLIDAAHKPVALLASQAADATLPGRGVRRWVPVLPEIERSTRDDFSRLIAWVANRALPAPCWIARDAAGAGRAVAGANATFDAGDFPEMLVDFSESADADIVALGALYVAALAPRLLMLPLTGDTRGRLEALAASQPVELARFWRLYPAVCDTALLNTARVQAQLMETA